MERKQKQPGKSVGTRNDEVAADSHSEKIVEVTDDLPFDFVSGRDTTEALWTKLGLPLPKLEANEDQWEDISLESMTNLQRRLYRGAIFIKKGQLLENRQLGAEFKKFSTPERIEKIYGTVKKLPFEFSEENIERIVKVIVIELYKSLTLLDKFFAD